MVRSVYAILTIDRWESLNCMKYRTASLRPVHGRLALKFLKWVVKQPGLELTHITHLYCITTHILVRARMYDCAKSILKYLPDMGLGSSSVFDALMDTYPLCNSSPAVFDLLIRVYVRMGAADDALEAFRLMRSRGFRPSVCTCNMILSAMAKVRCAESVWLFFGEIVENGICPNVATFNIVLSVLCGEGKLKKASYLLGKMEESGYPPTVVSYNTLLNWYCKKGRYKEAIRLLDHMSSRGIEADVCTYNVLIDDSCKNGRSAKGYLLLKKMRKRMVVPNEVTYNTLINGFVKEGKLTVAGKLYDEMCKVDISPNCITYNALIDGHCHTGNFVEAFRLLDEMQAKGLRPNQVTYGSLLDGLCKHGKLDSARNLLARIKLDGVAINSIMYTTLMDGVCGSGELAEAMELLDEMFRDNTHPDIVTYSVLVNGFSRAGKIHHAKEIICKLVRSGIRMNKIVYSTLICNLCRLGDINEAIRFYTMMLRSGHCPDAFIFNLLISTLCRSGNMAEAEALMHHVHRIGLTNSATFDAIIGGCINIGDVSTAFELFDEMVKSGYQPSIYTYGSLLKGLCKGGYLQEALNFFTKLRHIPHATDIVTYNTMLSEMFVHGYFKLALRLIAEMVQTNMFPDSYTYSCLIAGLCRTGNVVPATLLLERGLQRGTISPNQFMYSSIISGLVKIGQGRAGIYFFDNMVSQGLNPDIVTLNAVIDACSRTGDLDKLDRVMSMMESQSLSPSLATYNILLHGESVRENICGCFAIYKTILRNGYVPDKFTCHSLILGLCKSGMLDLGTKFLKMMIVKGTLADHLTFNMLITMYSQRGDMSKAYDLLKIMRSVGISPSEDTLSSIFNGLKRISRFHESRVLLHEMLKNGFPPTIRQYSRLITSMCKSGDIRGALKLRDEMEAVSVSSRDVAESALVRGLMQSGKTENGMLFLKGMLMSKRVPTIPTFTTAIHALCKESKLSEAMDLKLLMEKSGARPDAVTYNVLLTSFYRSGEFGRVFTLYEEMKRRNVCPDATSFSILIDAVSAEKNSAKGESILVDLEERGFVSQSSTAEPWDLRLADAAANINLMKGKKERLVAAKK